jgi:hypothetical protein
MGKKVEAEAVVLRTSLSVKMLRFERKGAAIQGCRNMKELPLANNGLRRHGKPLKSAQVRFRSLNLSFASASIYARNLMLTGNGQPHRPDASHRPPSSD